MPYPTNIDTLPTDVTKATITTAVPHAANHNNANIAIIALETKLGINGDTNNASHDFKLSEITSSDKAVGKSATQTLSNKTLTSPTINTPSIVNGTSTGTDNGTQTLDNKTFTTPRIATIKDASGLDSISLTGDSGTGSQIQSASSNINADLKLKAKGAGVVKLGTAEMKFPNTAPLAGQVLYAVNPSTIGYQTNSTRDTLVYNATAETGAINAYVIDPSLPAYSQGITIIFKATNANTGASTVNVSALGIKNIIKNGTQSLVSGDILAGQIVMAAYDGTSFQLISRINMSASTIGNYVVYRSTTPSITSSPTLTKFKEVRIGKDIAGSINVRHNVSAGNEPRSQIYKNGVAFGTLRNSLGLFNETLSFNEGDTLEIWLAETLAGTTTLDLFAILSDKPLVTSPNINFI